MKKTFPPLISLILFFSPLFCLGNDSREISLLTCSPGDEIYSVFGHSAIRVTDYEQGSDVIYNFGMFSFGTSNFALKFAKGSLKYCLGKQYVNGFIIEYTDDNRLIIEQVLQLTDEQKEAIISRLEFLYLPENRNYLYSFLEKNCATEIRDLLETVILKKEGEKPLFQREAVNETSRQLISRYLKQNLWTRLGINLALGRPIDKPNDSYKRMFLPDYLYVEVAQATNNGQSLVKEEHPLNHVAELEPESVWWYSPFLVFSLLFLIVFFWQNRATTLISFIFIAIIGTVILALNLFSDHPETKTNFNLLWCNPFYFIYLPFVIKNKIPKFLPPLFLFSILLTFIFWMCGIQQFDVAILPLLLILILLNFRLWRKVFLISK